MFCSDYCKKLTEHQNYEDLYQITIETAQGLEKIFALRKYSKSCFVSNLQVFYESFPGLAVDLEILLTKCLRDLQSFRQFHI